MGLSLLEHDANNFSTIFALYTDLLVDSKADPSKIFNKPSYFLSYDKVQVWLSLMACISTGDEKFIIPIKPDDAKQFLVQIDGYRPNCSYQFDGIEDVPSNVYLAMHQLVKNSAENLEDAKKKPRHPNKIEDKIEIILKNKADSYTLIVKDAGTGIPSDKLPIIFGAYTDGGTGIGLQVVKRIADLRKGYVEVVSTPGERTFRYNTHSGEFSEMWRQPQGTTFTLCLPKAINRHYL